MKNWIPKYAILSTGRRVIVCSLFLIFNAPNISFWLIYVHEANNCYMLCINKIYVFRSLNLTIQYQAVPTPHMRLLHSPEYVQKHILSKNFSNQTKMSTEWRNEGLSSVWEHFDTHISFPMNKTEICSSESHHEPLKHTTFK